MKPYLLQIVQDEDAAWAASLPERAAAAAREALCRGAKGGRLGGGPRARPWHPQGCHEGIVAECEAEILNRGGN